MFPAQQFSLHNRARQEQQHQDNTSFVSGLVPPGCTAKPGFAITVVIPGASASARVRRGHHLRGGWADPRRHHHFGSRPGPQPGRPREQGKVLDSLRRSWGCCCIEAVMGLLLHLIPAALSSRRSDDVITIPCLISCARFDVFLSIWLHDSSDAHDYSNPYCHLLSLPTFHRAAPEKRGGGLVYAPHVVFAV